MCVNFASQILFILCPEGNIGIHYLRIIGVVDLFELGTGNILDSYVTPRTIPIYDSTLLSFFDNILSKQ